MFARTRSSIAVALLTSAVLAWSAAPSQAQNPGLNPTFGSVNLNAGFTPDPFVKDVTAGGPVKTKLGGFSAFVANAPDFRLNYTKGTYRLTIRVESSVDTTLLINLPNGQWVANDDGDAANPTITFNAPLSGRYDIFVGTFGAKTGPARLFISETAQPAPAKETTDVPTPSLNPFNGSVTLKSGFLPDPFERKFAAGGHIKTTLGGVTAFVSKAPEFRLNYTKGSTHLVFRVESKFDTTLLINLPNGKWIASDDSIASRNPKITINAPESGRYDIFVGTVVQGPEQCKLIITEK